MDFRHEWKHQIRYGDLLALRSRLEAVMARDVHAKQGVYHIRSLYFDNLADKALREKLDGVNGREKFRIRYYNGDTSLILLEKKSKLNGLCSKDQAQLTPWEVEAVAREEFLPLADSRSPLVRELYRKIRSQGLAPKTIVDYTREPFVFAPGNVRVTLDYHIRTGLCSTDFLDPDCVTVPVEGNPIILEVKWGRVSAIGDPDIVQVPTTHTSAFSKYAVCRVYD